MCEYLDHMMLFLSNFYKFGEPLENHRCAKQYVDKVFEEQMEITNLTGNISSKDGEVYLHVHLTCSRRDYTCVGGHLLKARINGACELLVTDFGLTSVGRRFDPETGLNLYDF